MIKRFLRNKREILTTSELKKHFLNIDNEDLSSKLDSLNIQGKIIKRKNKILWIFSKRKELDSLILKGIEI